MADMPTPIKYRKPQFWIFQKRTRRVLLRPQTLTEHTLRPCLRHSLTPDPECTRRPCLRHRPWPQTLTEHTCRPCLKSHRGMDLELGAVHTYVPSLACILTLHGKVSCFSAVLYWGTRLLRHMSLHPAPIAFISCSLQSSCLKSVSRDVIGKLEHWVPCSQTLLQFLSSELPAALNPLWAAGTHTVSSESHKGERSHHLTRECSVSALLHLHASPWFDIRRRTVKE